MKKVFDRRPLTGKELRVAAEKHLPVYYVEEYPNPMDSHMNFHNKCWMKPANAGYYIGNSDINPEYYKDEDIVEGDFLEGTFGVYAIKGIKYEG
jgi:hypothetical protein